MLKYYSIDLDIDICDEDHTLVCVPYEQNELKHEQNNNNSLFSIGNISKEIINEDNRQKCLLTVDVIPRSEGQETITVKKVIILKHYSNSNVKNVIFSKGILSMNKKVNKIIKQKLNYKKELQNRLPEETCNKIWEKIHQRLTSYYEEYKDLPKRIASHTDTFIFPAAAIYLSIKEYAPDQAFHIMEKMMKERAIKAGESFAKMSKIPGFKTLFFKIWDSMSITTFGEKSGFKNKIYPVQNGEHKMDITHCPYHHYLTKLGCPELTILFCKNDEYSYGNIPGIKFTRTKTIGGGAELCDFKISKN